MEGAKFKKQKKGGYRFLPVVEEPHVVVAVPVVVESVHVE